MSDHGSSPDITEVALNSIFERFARAGYVMSGLLHLIIGYLAIGLRSGTAAVTQIRRGRWRRSQANGVAA